MGDTLEAAGDTASMHRVYSGEGAALGHREPARTAADGPAGAGDAPTRGPQELEGPAGVAAGPPHSPGPRECGLSAGGHPRGRHGRFLLD